MRLILAARMLRSSSLVADISCFASSRITILATLVGGKFTIGGGTRGGRGVSSTVGVMPCLVSFCGSTDGVGRREEVSSSPRELLSNICECNGGRIDNPRWILVAVLTSLFGSITDLFSLGVAATIPDGLFFVF